MISAQTLSVCREGKPLHTVNRSTKGESLLALEAASRISVPHFPVSPSMNSEAAEAYSVCSFEKRRAIGLKASLAVSLRER
jgi:hypothetical protein